MNYGLWIMDYKLGVRCAVRGMRRVGDEESW